MVPLRNPGIDLMTRKIGILQRLFAIVRIVVGLTGFVVLLAQTPLAYFYGRPLLEGSHPQPSEVIILMSHGQINASWLSLEGTQRTFAALRLYKMGFAPYIISTGSSLAHQMDQAGLQAKWLELAGVPSDALIVERQSTRTYESAVEVEKILKARGWKSAVVVASEMDIPRIRAVFAKLGVQNLSFEEVPEFRKPSSTTIYYSAGWNVFFHASYEYAGLLLYKWKGWI